MKLTYRAHNGYNTEQASEEATIFDDSPSLTIQAHAEDANINVMMKRMGITGQLPPNGVRIPEYGDFTGIGDYRSALEAVQRAQQHFMEIPAEIRAQFDNDPQNFLVYASDPNNLPNMVKLGLAKEKPRATTDGSTNQNARTENVPTTNNPPGNASPTGGGTPPAGGAN